MPRKTHSRCLLPDRSQLLTVAGLLLFGFAPTTRIYAENRGNDKATDLPRFAVVAIHPVKPSGPGPHYIHVKFTWDGFLDEGAPLGMIVRAAFGVSGDRIIGLPDWVRSDHYYIQAKVDPSEVPQFDKLTKQQRWGMVVALFEDRFALKFHRETRRLPTYGLIVANGGPKLREATPTELAGERGTPAPKVSGSQRGIQVEMRGASMTNIVDLISRILRSAVTDRTRLTGRYDFTLDYSSELAAPSPMDAGSGSSSAAPWPSIFTAVQDQLGLKLIVQKEPVEVFVIDHIQPPSPN